MQNELGGIIYFGAFLYIVGIFEFVIGRVAERVLRVAEGYVAVQKVLLLLLDAPRRIVEAVLEAVAHVLIRGRVKHAHVAEPRHCRYAMSFQIKLNI